MLGSDVIISISPTEVVFKIVPTSSTAVLTKLFEGKTPMSCIVTFSQIIFQTVCLVGNYLRWCRMIVVRIGNLVIFTSLIILNMR